MQSTRHKTSGNLWKHVTFPCPAACKASRNKDKASTANHKHGEAALSLIN